MLWMLFLVIDEQTYTGILLSTCSCVYYCIGFRLKLGSIAIRCCSEKRLPDFVHVSGICYLVETYLYPVDYRIRANPVETVRD